MTNGLLGSLFIPTKRKIFVSYHHGGDQWYYNEFSRIFSDTYDVVQDSSLDRAIDSDDPDYVMRRIRENNITGTSCTIVLCGAQTPQRKYVDWEIKAALDKCHGLIGINLPGSILSNNGVFVPDRFNDNYHSGYAVWLQWHELTTQAIAQAIELANSRPPTLINNSRQMRRRNG
ncbi:TIR domain-containing protein [Candidatus Thiodiazotropha sp. CDECU1]|uniref:TIR domain-containing protein n=1 Tax=Candidatus Thiodiazotropha sp. CDECU1 TaxID=3065865 RepID=UPI00292F8369|nr:TIR domain-containing protein [Candidatus Thiodiazotropha sp. CDECU1]